MEVANRLSVHGDAELPNGDHKGLQSRLCSQGRSRSLLAPGSQGSPCAPVPSPRSLPLPQRGLGPPRLPTSHCTCPQGGKAFGKWDPWVLPPSPACPCPASIAPLHHHYGSLRSTLERALAVTGYQLGTWKPVPGRCQGISKEHSPSRPAPVAGSSKHCGVWNEDPAVACPAGPGALGSPRCVVGKSPRMLLLQLLVFIFWQMLMSVEKNPPPSGSSHWKYFDKKSNQNPLFF